MIEIDRLLKEYGLRFRERYFAHYVFVHINRTGGSSIEAALGLPFRHRTAIEMRNALGEARWSKRFSFAFVRNPWDKVASQYHYRVLTNQTSLGVNPIGFNEWVKLTYGEKVPRYYDKPKMFMPQVVWISDRTGTILVNYVGRFENLDADFKEVCSRLGTRARLPHLKKSAKGPYQTLYTPECIEIVAKWFAHDIETFGYTFK